MEDVGFEVEVQGCLAGIVVGEGFGRLFAFLVQAKEDLSRNLSTTTQEND